MTNKESNGNGFSMSFRPKFSKHIIFTAMSVGQGYKYLACS